MFVIASFKEIFSHSLNTLRVEETTMSREVAPVIAILGIWFSGDC